MEFDYIFKAIVVIVGIVNAWMLVASKYTRDDAKEAKKKEEAEKEAAAALLAEARSIAVTAKQEAERSKDDIKAIKADIHSLTGTMIESINKLDSRLHNFIVAQVKTGSK